MKNPRPNILLVVMDTARASSFSCYGAPRSTTPTVDRLAEQGVLFLKAVSPSPWTLPSHVSLFTGLHPSEHRMTEDRILGGKNIYSVKAGHNISGFLPQVLKKEGYQTAGFSNNPWISSHFGFDQGFDRFHENWRASRNGNILRGWLKLVRKWTPQRFHPLLNDLKARMSWLAAPDSGAESTIHAWETWFSRDYQPEKPFFAFFNFMEPHLPYVPPKPYKRLFADPSWGPRRINRVNQDHLKYIAGKVEMSREDFHVLTALYEGEIAYLDSRLKRIVDSLDARGILDECLIVITSDHGENIGDHDLMGHQFCLYNTLLRVPLVLRGPGISPRGRVEDKCVLSTDLYYTILDMLEIPLDRDTEGNRSILDEGYNSMVVAEHEVPKITLRALKERFPDFKTDHLERELRCLYADGWKFILNGNGRDELYDLRQDPGEERNLIEKEPAVASRMRKVLVEWAKSRKKIQGDGRSIRDSRNEADEEILDKLKGLGYI